MSCNSKKNIFMVLHSWFQSSAKSKALHVIAGGGTGVALTDERRGQGQRSNQQAARATWPVQITCVEFQPSLNSPGIFFERQETVFAVFTVVPPSLSILVSADKTTERVFRHCSLRHTKGRKYRLLSIMWPLSSYSWSTCFYYDKCVIDDSSVKQMWINLGKCIIYSLLMNL